MITSNLLDLDCESESIIFQSFILEDSDIINYSRKKTMILDKFTVKNTILFVLIKLFILNFLTSIHFRTKIFAIVISLVVIGVGWYMMWIYILQRFKLFRELFGR